MFPREMLGLFAPSIVWGTWLLVGVTDLWYVARFGLDIPYWDDWSIVPVAAGQMPLSLDWLWAFQGDHRIPLPKLLFVALYRLTDDVRVIMFANLAILSLVALLGVIAVRQCSGRTRLTDAVIPLSLAGIANYSNLVSANQIQYISSIGLFCVMVHLVLRHPDWFSVPTVALVGICALCLPLTGSTGLALAIPILALLPIAAWLHRHSVEPRVRSARRLAFAVSGALLLMVVAYNVFDYRPASPQVAAVSSPQQFVTGVAQLAAVGFAAPPFSAPPLPQGDLGRVVAPYFAPEWVARTWRLRSIILVAAAGIAAVGLLWPVVRRRGSLSAVIGPVACIASAGVLAAAIGYARGSGLDQRYVVLGATLLFATYVCLARVTHRVATVAAWGLFLTSLVLLPWNAYNAISFGEARRGFETDLLRDIRAGVPVDLLGTRYYEDLWGDPTLAAGVVKEMRDDRIGPFAHDDLRLNESEPSIAGEETISTTPVAVHNMTRVSDYWQTSGGDAFMLFSVGSRELAGVRLKYSLRSATSSPAYLQVAWSDSVGTGFDTKGNRFVVWGTPTTAEQQQLVAWIGNRVGMLRITPDIRPVWFKLDEVVLLLSS